MHTLGVVVLPNAFNPNYNWMNYRREDVSSGQTLDQATAKMVKEFGPATTYVNSHKLYQVVLIPIDAPLPAAASTKKISTRNQGGRGLRARR